MATDVTKAGTGVTTVRIAGLGLKFYPSGWRGNGAVRTASIGRGLGILGAGLAVAGTLNDYRSWQSGNLSLTKFAINGVFTGIGLLGGPMGTAASITYFAADQALGQPDPFLEK